MEDHFEFKAFSEKLRTFIRDNSECGAARLRFSGVHRAMFFGIPPTGREIVWSGAAFFHIISLQIISLWVLGDVDAVKRQLGAASTSSGP